MRRWWGGRTCQLNFHSGRLLPMLINVISGNVRNVVDVYVVLENGCHFGTTDNGPLLSFRYEDMLQHKTIACVS